MRSSRTSHLSRRRDARDSRNSRTPTSKSRRCSARSNPTGGEKPQMGVLEAELTEAGPRRAGFCDVRPTPCIHCWRGGDKTDARL